MDKAKERLVGVMMNALDTRGRRLFLGAFADYLGSSGVQELYDLTGVSRTTIRAGRKQTRELSEDPHGRGAEYLPQTAPVRRKQEYPGLREALFQAMEGDPHQDPDSPICWTTHSLRQLTAELNPEIEKPGYVRVSQELEQAGFSMNLKRLRGEFGLAGDDTDQQFRHIDAEVRSFLQRGLPVLFLDLNRSSLREAGPDPEKENDAGNRDRGLELESDESTIRFAAECLETWWRDTGSARFPAAEKLWVSARGIGQHRDLWQMLLKGIAVRTGLELKAAHFPPGTFRWTCIEEEQISSRSRGAAGNPAETTVITLQQIGPAAVPDAERRGEAHFDTARLVPDAWRGEWNYSIVPERRGPEKEENGT